MSRPSSHLLNRIRRNRVPRLLLVLSILLNIGFSSLCMADTLPLANDVPPSALVQVDTPLPAMSAACGIDLPDDCLHSETGDCHCTCAHSAAMQGQALRSLIFVPTVNSWGLSDPGHAPAAVDSILRPPIA